MNSMPLIANSPISTNMITISLIFLTLFLILISSILLLLYDIYQDKKNYIIRQMPDNDLRNYIYKKLEHFKGIKLCMFAWYISYYQNPVIDIFTQYTHDHPRFIRFFTEIVIILLSLAMSLLPFTFKWLTIDTITNDVSLPRMTVMLSTFAISFCASLFARLCIFAAFYKVNNHSHMKMLIWNPIKSLFKEHIFNSVKKDVLLNDNWSKIKMRIIAVNSLCGRFIKKSKHGKVYKYLKVKRKENGSEEKGVKLVRKSRVEAVDGQEKRVSSAEYKLDSSFEIDNKDLKEDRSKVFPLLNSFDEEYEEVLDKSGYDASKPMNSSRVIQSKYSFMLSSKQSYLLSNHTLRRFKQIASKYIYNANNLSRYSINIIDDTSSKEKENYTIEHNDNYSYLSPSPIKEKDILAKARQALSKTLLVILSLIIILGGTYTLLYFAINQTYPDNHRELVFAWLLPSLLQIFLLGFVFNYIRTLISALLLFKMRKYRKRNKCIRFLSKVFVEKFMIDMFKLRNLISKYHREFTY